MTAVYLPIHILHPPFLALDSSCAFLYCAPPGRSPVSGR